MQINFTDNGCLTMLLSDDELSAMGLSFTALDRRDPKTQRMLRTLLQVAHRRVGFSPRGALSVEALPTVGGCLLLVTPLGGTQGVPAVFHIADEDALLQIASAWQQPAHPSGESSSLYRTEDGFRLVLYGVTPFAALNECARPTAEEAAFVAEHGHAWFIGDALPQLFLRTHSQ